MPIFPLDSVRNAGINRDVELVLEDVREAVAAFPFDLGERGDAADVLAVYDAARPRLNVVASSLLDLHGSSGIDISAGFGFLSVVLKRYGIVAAATERDPAQCAFAADCGINVLPYSLGGAPLSLPDESLDFLILAEVIEHLKIPPIRVILEVTRVLRQGGRFILTTPNIARLAHLEALLAGDNFLEPFEDSLPAGADPTDFIEHVREYAIGEIADAIEGAGLAIDRVLMTGWGDAGYHPLPNPHINEICVVQATK